MPPLRVGSVYPRGPAKPPVGVMTGEFEPAHGVSAGMNLAFSLVPSRTSATETGSERSISLDFDRHRPTENIRRLAVGKSILSVHR